MQVGKGEGQAQQWILRNRPLLVDTHHPKARKTQGCPPLEAGTAADRFRAQSLGLTGALQGVKDVANSCPLGWEGHVSEVGQWGWSRCGRQKVEHVSEAGSSDFQEKPVI